MAGITTRLPRVRGPMVPGERRRVYVWFGTATPGRYVRAIVSVATIPITGM